MDGSGSGDPPARRHTLLGDAERDRLVAMLREHYAAGRFGLAELRRRAEIVLAAAYLDEAEVALTELPAQAVDESGAGPGTSREPRRSRPARRGHAGAAVPAPGWLPTAERFRDPSSGVIVRVWVDLTDGSRHYVPDDATPAG